MSEPVAALPQGVHRLEVLPGEHTHDGDSDWDRILLPEGDKERLLNQALLILLHRKQLQAIGMPPQGLIVLAGPPGTGKTTLARGLAFEVAHELAPARGTTTFVEFDPHSLPSEMLGESQRRVTKLLLETIPELAARRSTTIVLIDEVEAFAIRRSAASFQNNPIDVHRATDAVLLGLDEVMARCPGVLFVATTNFPEAIDEAMLSRADFIMRFSLPNCEIAGEIIRRSLSALAIAWPPVRELAEQTGEIENLAERCSGWDGRRLSKLVLVALAQRAETVRDPGLLQFEDLWAARDNLEHDSSLYQV